MADNLFCPKWVFDICSAMTAYDYIVNDVPIDISCKKYSRGLNEKYREVKFIEIKNASELIIKFMGKIKNPEYEPYERLKHFLFFTLKYETYYKKRKYKTLFGSAYDGTKEKEYEEESTLQEFKTFVYSLRSNLVKKAPKSWDIKEEDDPELDFLISLINKNFGINDLIESLDKD